MKGQTATYGKTRTDWSSEIKSTRAASDTGRGGMEREASHSMEQEPRNGMESNPQSVTATQDEWLADDTALDTQWNDQPVPMRARVVGGQELTQTWPNIENHLSNEEIEAPTTMEEVYRGSMKALLLRNVGNYVVATFLIGTQTTVSWEGILYDVGNDYLAIYQSGRDQYIVSDLYSLKYVEFYDTRRRELCDSLLTQQEPSGNAQRQ